jgi:2-oxoglutarate dehydrogenase E1 component
MAREDRGSGALVGFGVNAGIVAEIRERWRLDPGSVDPDWAAWFSDQAGARSSGPAEKSPVAALPPPRVPFQVAPAAPRLPSPRDNEAPSPQVAEKHARVLRLIHSYRARGHRIARTDPLGGSDSYFPELDPAHYGFGHEDLERAFIAGDLPGGPVQTLREILERLRQTYCRTVGVEFTHVQDPGRKLWLQHTMEAGRNEPALDAEERLRVLEKLAAAELFERFLHTKFLGQKRFSLEGAESLIPLLDTLVEEAPERGVREVVLGMAHRGRLNVLSNILDKSLESIFSEFEDTELVASPFGSGDVKYHKGFSRDRRTRSGARIHLSLTANPSHLEAVNPVVEGRVRAKQTRRGDARGVEVVPVLIHGDAAFAGQGIVAETLNLCHLEGYSTGGTIHVVVNNQIGFTTTPAEARSTLYCTDVAKMIQAPIFHVNGDDPEAVVHCVKLAFEYRQRFGDDVVIDMVCYRRNGHNEGDEPSFTQPLLYERIRAVLPVRAKYTEELVRCGLLSAESADRIESDLGEQLQQALQIIKTRPPAPDEPYDLRGPWRGFQRVCPTGRVETAVPVERLAQIGEGLGTYPPEFSVHPKLRKLIEQRRKAVAEGAPIDWALGEALAFGSLLVEGTPVRLSGQDSSRGTFNHRHAVLVDQQSGAEWAPLDHLTRTQARFEVYDSHLSEAAVLGFEYGYSLADPTTLTLWEAQFGDFANGAQVIIDQFITAAHVKWGRMSGLVMLLPHGYEGQGPEHSSGRIERFLQLCAEDNLQVVNCTTPAQYFHVLRRQMRRPYRAPLVVLTPKRLLRHPGSRSSLAELTHGRFSEVLDDAAVTKPAAVRRLLLCSGKIYYELLERLEERAARIGRRDVALVRIEQLYPWPEEAVARALLRYPAVERVVWVQEEPANMGSWTFLRERIQGALPPTGKLAYAGRTASASPAGGSMRGHRREQAALLAAAFEGLD